MPSSHRRYADWTIGRIRRDAALIGPATAALCELILEHRPHPEQGFRSCLGILRLAQASVRSILDRKLDRHAAPILRNLDPGATALGRKLFTQKRGPPRRPRRQWFFTWADGKRDRSAGHKRKSLVKIGGVGGSLKNFAAQALIRRGPNYQPLFHGQQGGIFPRICGAQAKIVGENRRSHPAEKTQHTWALGTRGADRLFRYPPLPPGHLWGDFDPPSNSDPPSTPP